MHIQRSSLLRLCVWAGLLAVCWAQRVEQLVQNPCSGQTTCSDCIRTASCAWCFASEFNGPRCFDPSMEAGSTGSCDEAYTFNPDNQVSVDPVNNLELSRVADNLGTSPFYGEPSGTVQNGSEATTASSGGSIMIMKPQRVKLQLRLNEMYKLSFTYTHAQDYPIDLYYLMDLTRSMKDDKERVAILGDLLLETMKNISSDFRVGFGSFGEKPVMPYVSTQPRRLMSPCDGCVAPYSFKNHMSLSNDTQQFIGAVAMATVTGNLDASEGGFDALMQAVVCKPEIGWRDQARRLLVFATDASFHIAGDGKLGGIVAPNDGQCHLENGFYTHSTIQDYPSISQIGHMVKKLGVNVIFAVTAEQISLYEELIKHIEGSSSGVLSNDSANIVDVVLEQYNKLTAKVAMTDSASNAVQIKYYSSCPGHDGLVPNNKCAGVKVGDVVEFSAEITLKKCPKDRRRWKQIFDIFPVGISDSLTVELDMICDCSACEQAGDHINDSSPICSGHGVSTCGECVCKAGYFGKNCECSAHDGGACLS